MLVAVGAFASCGKQEPGPRLLDWDTRKALRPAGLRFYDVVDAAARADVRSREPGRPGFYTTGLECTRELRGLWLFDDKKVALIVQHHPGPGYIGSVAYYTGTWSMDAETLIVSTDGHEVRYFVKTGAVQPWPSTGGPDFPVKPDAECWLYKRPSPTGLSKAQALEEE